MERENGKGQSGWAPLRLAIHRYKVTYARRMYSALLWFSYLLNSVVVIGGSSSRSSNGPSKFDWSSIV